MEEKGYYRVSDEIHELIFVHDYDIYYEDHEIIFVNDDDYHEYDEDEGGIEYITMEDVRNNNYKGHLMLYVENSKLDNLNDYLINGEFPKSLAIINCSKNNLQELPELPEDLLALNCSYNNLQEIPDSIEKCSWMKRLNCSNNNLETLRIPLSFVENFDNWKSHGDEEDVFLAHLNCSFNKLTKLPDDIPSGDRQIMNKLPHCLETLICNNNLITSLPELLPMSVKHLNCSFNSLTSIPILINNPISPESTMNGLLFFYCYDNEITQLPELPNDIKFLNCSNNKLTTLPNLPNDLNFLNCSNNKLTTLPNLPNDLNFLKCQGNDYDDESMIIIIDFCKKALKNPREYNQINPTIKELFKYYTSIREHRAKVFREPFTETEGAFTQESGKTIQKGNEASFKPKPIPEGSIIDILEYAKLPTPPPPRKNIGGKKNRKSNKRNTSTKKNTKRITKRKTLIKNKSKRNKKN
jgi:hypothetical protein